MTLGTIMGGSRILYSAGGKKDGGLAARGVLGRDVDRSESAGFGSSTGCSMRYYMRIIFPWYRMCIGILKWSRSNNLKSKASTIMAAVSIIEKVKPDIQIFDNEDALSISLAKYTADLSESFVKERGALTVVVSGGSLIISLREKIKQLKKGGLLSVFFMMLRSNGENQLLKALSRLNVVIGHPNAMHSDNVMAYDNVVLDLGRYADAVLLGPNNQYLPKIVVVFAKVGYDWSKGAENHNPLATKNYIYLSTYHRKVKSKGNCVLDQNNGRK
ncbi:hypothetical protein IFM89_033586 [Coptis chinensis]|uniref:Uncharacterized protein n=1 Tax=Coptis chinensis TaxID=261450 RepID=A0A835I7I8_9MAGN|nr:hypothetical protein IFM89_033586 [Coptis chinensis]